MDTEGREGRTAPMGAGSGGREWEPGASANVPELLEVCVWAGVSQDGRMITAVPFRWLGLLAFSMLPLALPAVPNGTGGAAPGFMRGVNISHWLSQNHAGRPYGADWFSEEDVAWIAAQGFDHIRYPVDGRLWLKPDGTLDAERMKPLTKALAWTQAKGLGAILDMHFLPGADFNNDVRDTRVFEDEALMAKVADFWGRVARAYADHGPYLRFELLNEAVARQNDQLNTFHRVMLAAVRESNPTRVVYVGSNRWNGFSTINDLKVPADPNVAVTLHFYEPMVFTHQRAGWVEFKPTMPVVPFPGKVPDLTGHVPAGGWAMNSSLRELTVGQIDEAFAKVAVWAAEHAKGREIHLGEFGVYQQADDASKLRWLEAVRQACARHGFGWAVWDYQGGFAVRAPDGSGTTVLKGLFPR